MKATLHFDLEDFGQQKLHRRCTNATNAYLAFHDIDNLLREITKYGKGIRPGDKIALPEGYHEITETQSELLHAVISGLRGSINNILEDRKIDMDDLE